MMMMMMMAMMMILRGDIKKNGIFWEFFPKGGGASQFPKLFYIYRFIFCIPKYGSFFFWGGGSLFPKSKNREFLGGPLSPKVKTGSFFGGSPIPKSKIDQNVEVLGPLIPKSKNREFWGVPYPQK